MKKILILLLLIGLLISCNNNKSIISTTENSITNIDTNEFHVDTVKIMKMSRLTSSNLYGLHCKMCHGISGKGDGVKARFDTTICPYDLTQISKPEKELYYVVLNGNERMPNQYELDTMDVWVIVIYIKKFKNE